MLALTAPLLLVRFCFSAFACPLLLLRFLLLHSSLSSPLFSVARRCDSPRERAAIRRVSKIRSRGLLLAA
jgi:hypothetical protein